MPTINGKACIVNGKPVDKVFSNGKQVYGRNLLSMTKNFKPTGAGKNFPNQNAGLIYFAGYKKVADLFKAGDCIAIYYEVNFLNTELYSESENVWVGIQMWHGNWYGLSSVRAKSVNGKFYTSSPNQPLYTENPIHKVTASTTFQLTQDFITANATCTAVECYYNNIPTGANLEITDLKIEKVKNINSVATPWTPAPEDVGAVVQSA